MRTPHTLPTAPFLVLVREEVQCDIVDTGGGVAITLARFTVVRMRGISKTKWLIIVEWLAHLALKYQQYRCY